jgi:hypothetical protein
MSALPIHQPQTPGKTPAGIRAALPDPERARFEADFQTCMSQAAGSYDLAPVQDCLDRWHPAAVIYAADPGDYQRMMREAEQLLAGENVPTMPWEETAGRLGLGG